MSAADGTTIGTAVTAGDVIATEDMPGGGARGSTDVPITDYKIARSKLAVGRYGTDYGDATPTNAIPTQSLHERWHLEAAAITHGDASRMAINQRQGYRTDLADRRGNTVQRGAR